MTIRDKGKFMDRLWDWGILKGCFGNTKIEPTDIDGLVERKGNFLLLEAKGPNVSLNTGQRITLENLQKTKRFVIIVVWGDTNQPQKLQVMGPKGTAVYEHADLETFRSIVSQWYEYADRNPINE